MVLTRIRRRKGIPLPFPESWEEILVEELPFYGQLATVDQEALKTRINDFLREKPFEGCAGFEVTDRVKMLVAAQAALLILHRQQPGYPTVSRVLIYPGAFRGRPSQSTEPDSWRAGEAWQRDYVILAWDHVLSGLAGGEDGRNVVIHEFAHHLDREDGTFDGVPPLPTLRLYRAWESTFDEEFERLKAEIREGRNPLLDPYGATNRAEFFAVASEFFFERPRDLRRQHRALYELLVLFYRQDPARPGRFVSRAVDSRQLSRRAAAYDLPDTARSLRLAQATRSVDFLMRLLLLVLMPLLVIGLFDADIYLTALWVLFGVALAVAVVSATVTIGADIVTAVAGLRHRITPRRRLETLGLELVTAAEDRGLTAEVRDEVIRRAAPLGFQLLLQYRHLPGRRPSPAAYYSLYADRTRTTLLLVPHLREGLLDRTPTTERFYLVSFLADRSTFISSNDTELSRRLPPESARSQLVTHWRPFHSLLLLHRHALEDRRQHTGVEPYPLATDGIVLRLLQRSALVELL